MPIQMIPNYRTGDGRTHDDLNLAIDHERHLMLCKAIFEDGRAPNGSIDAIADLVKRNFAEIKAVMETDLHREMIDDANERVASSTPPKIALSKTAESTIEKEIADAVAAASWTYDANGGEIVVGVTVRPNDKRFADNVPRRVTAINADGAVQIDGDSSWRPGRLFAVTTADGAAA